MRALVLGAGGFIGHHLVARLKEHGYQVVGADLKYPEFAKTQADEFLIGDLAIPDRMHEALQKEPPYDEMGGAQYIFTGEHDATIMLNSAAINLNLLRFSGSLGKIFYSSSACIYPAHIQETVDAPGLAEYMAYPAAPDSEYGWEKLFSERLYLACRRNLGQDVRIARFHNIAGPEGTYVGGREKAPAAICRKVAEARSGGSIDVLGDGEQTRSFLYIDDCLEGILALMKSSYGEPVNIGSTEQVTINQLAEMAIEVSGKKLSINHVPTDCQGVRGRNSHNELVTAKTGWRPRVTLHQAIEIIYPWVEGQVQRKV